MISHLIHFGFIVTMTFSFYATYQFYKAIRNLSRNLSKAVDIQQQCLDLLIERLERIERKVL